ncbi:muts domain V-domain-containing protein [Scenedesmus sp. NREL 46B-D3]|nr:muts domain V-domain-containing protein [Scenedesmus sp. NREL 46B-D3]
MLKLSVMQVPDDSKGACAFQMLQYVKLQVDPQIIVLPATAEAELLAAARAPAAAAAGAAVLGGDGSEGDAEVVVQLQRPSMFTYERALKMLAAVAQDDAGGGEGLLLVDKLTEMKLEGHLLIDGPSLSALDVFKEEEHPSAMGIGSSKEGASVYGLLQRCVTGMGKRLLRQWFLRPVVQPSVLADRHDTIQLLVEAPSTNDALRAAMKQVLDVPRLLAQMRLSQSRPRLAAFKQLANSINQLLQLQLMVATLAPAAAAHAAAGGAGEAGGADRVGQQPQPASGPWDELAITRRLLAAIGPQLTACGTLVGDVLDLSSPPADGCLVQPGVCKALDQLKATHAALPELLTQARGRQPAIVESQLQRVPAHVARRYSSQLWSMVYIPQVGFTMCVTGGRLAEELLELLPDYNLAFMGDEGPAAAAAAAGADLGGGLAGDGSCAYYYCECTQQLNSQYGDLQHKIQDLESSICTELIKRLLEFAPCLAAAAAAVAELDCLASFAAAARELGYVRPTLTTDDVLLIEGGRHPLTELLTDGRFIPNDTRLGLPAAAAVDGHADDQQPEAAGQCGPRMVLITGPNASGKSIYMKQVALLVYLAHVGSFVPAQRAVVGLRDRILTRLPCCSMEAVAQHASSFMTDLGQVSTILHRATSRSLVLLDEFGKGTLTSDGVGLLASVLQHYSAQAVPPMLLACTHFVELLGPEVLPPHPQLQLCTMQVLVAGRSSGDAGDAAAAAAAGVQSRQEEAAAALDEEHVFLYKLVQGKVAASYGLNCARMCGVDRAVLLRASDVLALQQAGQPVSRLALPELQQRDEQYWQLVQQLAALDVTDEAAVRQLLGAMMAVEAEAG